MQEKDTENQQENPSPRPSRSRRVNPFLLIAIIFVALVIYNQKPAIPHIYCNDDILKSKPEVIVLGTWWCPSCYQARRYLSENQISYCEYDIERSAEGEKLFNEVNGKVIPVLLVGDYMMSGFDEQRIEQVLARARDES
jgi:glutaredoxin